MCNYDDNGGTLIWVFLGAFPFDSLYHIARKRSNFIFDGGKFGLYLKVRSPELRK